MQKSTILFLLISCLLVSCGTAITKDYTQQGLETTNFEVPFFTDAKIDYVYKANITAYGHELSGIFIAKKVSDSIHRVVFTTEFGNKLLDVEISANDFTINSIVPELDRKIILNTLKKDFRLLLKQHYAFEKEFEKDNTILLQAKENDLYYYVFLTKNKERILKVIQGSQTKEKITIYFSSENNIFAEKIDISHQNIPLKIELNYFNQQ